MRSARPVMEFEKIAAKDCEKLQHQKQFELPLLLPYLHVAKGKLHIIQPCIPTFVTLVFGNCIFNPPIITALQRTFIPFSLCTKHVLARRIRL